MDELRIFAPVCHTFSFYNTLSIIMLRTISLILILTNFSNQNPSNYFTCGAVYYQDRDYWSKWFQIPDTQLKAFPLDSNVSNKVESILVKAGCVLVVHTNRGCGNNGWQRFQAKDKNVQISISIDGPLYRKISCVRCQC